MSGFIDTVRRLRPPKWHHVPGAHSAEAEAYTQVMELCGGCLVRACDWFAGNEDGTMALGLVFVPDVTLADFGIEQEE